MNGNIVNLFICFCLAKFLKLCDDLNVSQLSMKVKRIGSTKNILETNDQTRAYHSLIQNL